MAGALREILAHFGIEVDSKQVEHGEHSVDSLIGKLTHFGHAVAGVFAFHQIEGFVKATVDEARELDKSAVMAGMAADELQRLRHMFNMADVDAGELSAGLRFLQRNAAAAAEGSGEAAKSFKDLGISFEGGKVGNTTDLLYRTVDAIKAIEDPSKRTAQAIKIFGRGGLTMMPAILQGSEALREYAASFEHLGGGFSEDFMRRSAELEDHEKQLGMLWRSMRSQLVGQLIPAFLSWGRSLEKLGLWVMSLNKDGAVLRGIWVGALVAIIAKMPVLIGHMKTFAATTMLPLAGLILAALALEDISTWFRGGDSLIGRFFGLFDERVNKAAVELGDFFAFSVSGWDNFGKSISRVPSAVGMAIAVLDNEIEQWLTWVDAKILDWWDGILRKLHAPDWLQKLIGSEAGQNDTSGTANERRADEQARKSRERIGGQFNQELESTGWQDFFKAREAERWAKVPQTTPGVPESTPWAGMIEAAQAQPAMAVAGHGGSRVDITDNSKTEVKVDVHGMDPETATKKVGTAVAKATRRDHGGANEHTVD